ncbi:MAG: BON domain-containing protein [Desulfobacterales bacterium]|nr:BON domain-containing protein [Desulfobacterales bacterium]MBF0396938.1 BON domain-containing protein [Desulfobacterales bacterium]
MKKFLAVFLMLVSLVIVTGAVYAEEKAAPAAQTTEAAKTAEAAPAAKVDDATLVTQVKECLAKSKALKDVAIEVESKDGVVTLKGNVKNKGVKAAATKACKKVKGIAKVDNQIVVEKAKKAEKTEAKAEEKKEAPKAEEKK